MDRRQFLAGCGVLLAGVGAGCSGVFDSPAGPVPDATSAGTPTEPEPTPDPDRTPAGPDAAGSPESPPETPTATPIPTPSVEEREALTAYRAGYRRRGAYDRATRDARVGFERGKYGGAAVRYRDAVEQAERSATYFDWAAEWASRSRHPDARKTANAAAAYTRRYLVAFASRGVDASEAAKRGRIDEASEHVVAMRSIVGAAESAEVVVALPSVFEDGLGL